MNKLKSEELILEYLDEAQNSKRRAQLKKTLLKEGYSETYLNELESIYADLHALPDVQPGDTLNISFYAMLKKQEQSSFTEDTLLQRLMFSLKKRVEPRYVFRIAYSVILLFIGWNIGLWNNSGSGQDKEIQYLSSEIQQMKKLVSISILNHSSPSQRIKNVNILSSFQQADEQIITLLVNTLNNDSNVNVRLSAVEALFKLAKNNRVRKSLVHSLDNQDSPLIQLALIDCYITLNETQAIGHLKQLLQNKEINDVVRNQVQQSLKILI